MLAQLSIKRLAFCVSLTAMVAAPLAAEGEAPSAATQVLSLADHPGDRPGVATAVTISQDGETVAAAGDDHVVRVWYARTGKPKHRFVGHEDWVRGLQLAEDGERLASVGADHRLCLWALGNGRRLLTTQLTDGPLSSVSFHPNGQQLMTVGFRDPVRLFSLSSGNLDQTYRGPCEDTRCVVVSPDGKRMAAAGRNGRLRIWDLTSGATPMDVPASTRRIHAVAFSPDSKRIATAGDGDAIRIWDAASGDLARVLARQPAKQRSLVFVSNQLLAAGGVDNVIQLWDLSERHVVKRLTGHTGAVSALAISKAGDRLVSASFDTTIRIWHLAPAGQGNRSPTTASADDAPALK